MGRRRPRGPRPRRPARRSRRCSSACGVGGRRSRYRLRKQIVEPVFGIIKQAPEELPPVSLAGRAQGHGRVESALYVSQPTQAGRRTRLMRTMPCHMSLPSWHPERASDPACACPSPIDTLSLHADTLPARRPTSFRRVSFVLIPIYRDRLLARIIHERAHGDRAGAAAGAGGMGPLSPSGPARQRHSGREWERLNG